MRNFTTGLRIGCVLLGSVGFVRAAPPGALRMTARQRAPVSGGEFAVTEKSIEWSPQKTAIVICDMWDRHWCEGATRRVAEMAPRMNQVVGEARKLGVFIVHAPSSCMEAYKDTPQRKLAQAAPPARDLPADIEGWCRKLEHEPPLPIDDSDGGCDESPQCSHGSPWRRQIEAIEIAPGDAVTDQGREFWNLIASRGIENVIVMGVHTNMCVAGRPFALRQMAKNKKNVVLARDLTDSMYNSRKAPFVNHRRGTELVIEHIESHICPTIHSSDISGEARAPRVAFVIGEDEYDTRTTLPAFAKAELEPRGVRCAFVHENPQSPGDFEGLMDALEDADLVFLSVRRRTPTVKQLAAIREFLESGRPIVGIRTASHSFDKEPAEGRAAWHDLDRAVLGGHYQGHYGTKPPEGGPSIVRVVDTAAKHPVVAGLPGDEVKLQSHLYKYPEMAKTAKVLVEGRVEGREHREPVAWTNTFRGGRVFYTSLGSPADFEAPFFRRLLLNGLFWALDKEIPGPRPVSRAGTD